MSTSWFVGPSGGVGGDPFEDSLPAGAAIQTILVYFEDTLNGIGVSYSVNGGSSQTSLHGQSTGTAAQFTLQPGEYITSVNGRYGEYVDSMAITTNQRTLPTYGGSGGTTDYFYMIPSTAAFIGFGGRSGSLIDAIGLVLTGVSSPDLMAMPCICMGPAGGLGGNPFIDSPIPPGATIQSVQISSGSGEVRGIGVTYSFNNAVQALPMHGDTGTGGNTLTNFTLSPGEYITGISGEYGERINSLVIHTNQGVSQMFGGSGGSVPFNFQVPSGSDLIGFVGRAGAGMDAIGCVGREEGRLPPVSVPVYRFLHSSGAHFYSTSTTAPPAGYNLEGAVFHAFATQVYDTQPVIRFHQVSSNLYYYSFNSTPSAGWVNEGVAWYMFPPAYSLAGAVQLNSYAAGDQWFYAPANSGDNTTGYTPRGATGSVFALPMPIYRFTNGSLHYYCSDNTTIPAGYTLEGQVFFAFGEGVFYTLPVYRYLNGTTNAHAYAFRAADLPQGNWIYQGIAWYAYPPATPASGAKALSLYTNANGDFLYTTNPAAETLTGYTLAGVPAFVFAAVEDFTGITIPDRIIICGTDCLYTSYADNPEQGDPNSAISASSHWYGLVLTVNQQTTSNIINGTAGLAAITTLVGLGLAGISTTFPVAAPLAILAGVIAGVLGAMAAVLAAINQGNGLYFTFYWPVFVLPPPLLGLPIPSPV